MKLTVARMCAFYQTFSSIARLAAVEQEQLLDQLGEVAAEQFDGVVHRNMLTPVYLFRRQSGG